MHPIAAAVRLGERYGVRCERGRVLKDGSNLIVELWPEPVVVRVATVTAWVRRDAAPYLQREVALTAALAETGASVARPSPRIPGGPHEIDGWTMSATERVEHAGVVPSARVTLDALEALHDALARTDVALPVLGPARGDLDLAWERVAELGLLEPADLAERRLARDRLVEALDAVAPERQPLHGDAFPRNSLVAAEGRVVWIDLEDACLGPLAWDHAVLIRQGGDPSIEPQLRSRDGDAAIDAALALRALQAEAWTLIHDARAAGRLPLPSSYEATLPS